MPKYKVISVVGDRVEAENPDVAAVDFMEHVLRDSHAVMEAVVREVVVTDEESGEEVKVTLEGLRERFPWTPPPVKFQWPGWWSLLAIGAMTIMFSALDARGELGGEWGRKFAIGLPIYAAVIMSGWLSASAVNYLIKTRKNQ